jgi:CheY-like chemotaxis protein
MADTKSVLIVDDDKFLLEMYGKKFREAGFTATLVPNPQDALTKLRSGESPDILVLDIIMPGMDGLELLKTIRGEKLAEKAVVVMLTNESGTDRQMEAHDLRVDGYLVKASFIPSEVVEEVEKICKAKS